jgi:hypothetical protein
MDGHDPAHLRHALATICQWANAHSVPALPQPQSLTGATS